MCGGGGGGVGDERMIALGIDFKASSVLEIAKESQSFFEKDLKVLLNKKKDQHLLAEIPKFDRILLK